MRQLSEWWIALDENGKILKAAFALTDTPPKDFVYKTVQTLPHKDFTVYWYLNKPSEILEENIYLLTMYWLADGRLG